MVILLAYLKKSDVFIIVLCIIGLIFSAYWYYDFVYNKSYSALLNVNVDDRIDDNCPSNAEYYLTYDIVDGRFVNKNLHINYFPFKLEVDNGRTIENDFEIILSNKYKSLLNRVVRIVVNNVSYGFKVVGTHDNSAFGSNFAFVNESTRNIIYPINYRKSSHPYHYMFLFDNVDDISDKLDAVVACGYHVKVVQNKKLKEFDNFYSIIDAILLLAFVLFSIILIIIGFSLE